MVKKVLVYVIEMVMEYKKILKKQYNYIQNLLNKVIQMLNTILVYVIIMVMEYKKIIKKQFNYIT